MFKNKISIECKILQPELLRSTDVLIFTANTKSDLTPSELEALKFETEKFLRSVNISNVVMFLNNSDMRVVSSIIT